MVKYLGLCRPLGQKVEFTVDEVRGLETSRGKKWQIKGHYEDYNISTFASESVALGLLEQLESTPQMFDAEVAHISAEEVYEMEELLPFPLSWNAEEEPEEDTPDKEEPVTSSGGNIVIEEPNDDQGLLESIPSLEDEMVEAGIEGREKVKANAVSKEFKGAEESEDDKYKGLPKKYLKKDGTPDMRYKISREWLAGREEAIEEQEDEPSIKEEVKEEVLEEKGDTETITEEVTEIQRNLNPNTLTIPKTIYYEMIDILPETVTAKDTPDGTSVTLGFLEFDSPLIESIFATELPEGEEEIKVLDAEENIPAYEMKAEEYRAERTEKMKNIFNEDSLDGLPDGDEPNTSGDLPARIKSVGLVKGRHNIPVDEYIYEEIVHSNGFSELITTGLAAEARHWINRNLAGIDELHLYVTGFTPALTSFLVEWNKLEPECNLKLLHYDNENRDYVEQVYEAEDDLLLFTLRGGLEVYKEDMNQAEDSDQKAYFRGVVASFDSVIREIAKKGVESTMEELMVILIPKARANFMNLHEAGLMNQTYYYNAGKISGYEECADFLSPYGVDFMMGMSAEERDLTFREWAEEELDDENHEDDVTFDDWLDEEIKEHGDVPLSEWKKDEHEESAHQAEFQYFDSEMKNLLDKYVETIYPNSADAQEKLMNDILSGQENIDLDHMRMVVEQGGEWPEWEENMSPEEEAFDDVKWDSEVKAPKTTTLATLLGLGALAAALAPRELRELFRRMGK